MRFIDIETISPDTHRYVPYSQFGFIRIQPNGWVRNGEPNKRPVYGLHYREENPPYGHQTYFRTLGYGFFEVSWSLLQRVVRGRWPESKTEGREVA